MADDVQQEPSNTEAPAAVAEAEAGEHQQSDPLEPSTQGQEGEVNPLEPGGDRFKQVWARAKTAEQTANELKEALAKEREERIRLEERQKAREEAERAAREAQVPEYTWAQLRGFIDKGELTLEQALEYRETLIQKKAEEKATKRIESHLKLNTREATIGETLAKYRTLKPELVTPGTPERKKLEQEYQYHVEVLGFPANHATELAAARAAFGDITTLESQQKLKTSKVEREGHMETATNHRPAPKAKDPVEQLSAAQKEHYTRMIKNGRYGSFRPHIGITDDHWKLVREELTWTRGKK